MVYPRERCHLAADWSEGDREESLVFLFNKEEALNHEAIIQISQTSFIINENASLKTIIKS